uniref:Acylglycerol lipase n=1 Tax=Rhipicephalus appendiculatus TaxID=34631 RepID=A0A131YXP3_RHIAP
MLTCHNFRSEYSFSTTVTVNALLLLCGVHRGVLGVVSLCACSCQCAVSRTPKQFGLLTPLNQNQMIHYHCNPSLLLQVYKDCYHSLLTEPEEMAQQVLQDIANWYSARIPS